MSDVLDQEEIDALMNGLSSGEVETGKASGKKTSKIVGGYSSYDFSREDYTLRKLWPALTLIAERFKQQFQGAFSALVRRGVALSGADIQAMNFEEYLNTQKDVTAISFLNASPLPGMVIATIDADLIYSAVDVFFGANDIGQGRKGSQAFTSAELRIMQRIVDTIIPAMKTAWDMVMPINFSFSHAETNPRFVKDFAPGDAMLVVTFDVEMGRPVGSIQIVIPVSTIESIKDDLIAIDGINNGIPDAEWTAEFKQGISDAQIELNVQLAQAHIHLRDLLNLKAGDVIPIDLPGKVDVYAGSIPVLRGQFGVSSGQKAVKVSAWVSPKKREKGE